MTVPRHAIPRLFDGAWDSVIVTTYGANLGFFEQDLLRQIERARNRIVFADERQVDRWLQHPERRSRLRQVNRSYVLAPVRSSHAAHAKLILLLAAERGRLAVGSGNLGLEGYASQGECFTTYSWSPDEPSQIDAFLAVREFLDELLARSLVDAVVRPRLQQAWQDAPWVYTTRTSPAPVRHNLSDALLDQFAEVLGDRQVAELAVHAPFYDHRCDALAALIRMAKPSRLLLLLQERITSVDPRRLAKVLADAKCDCEVRTVEADERGTFLHAKFLLARCGAEDVCLQGSPNISTPALLRPHPDGNVETANLLVGRRGTFDHLISTLNLSAKPRAIADLGLGLAENDDDGELGPCGPRAARLIWRPPRLTGLFEARIEVPPTLHVGEVAVEEVTWELTDEGDGSTSFTATLGDHGCDLLARVAAVWFEFEDGSSPAGFPYHLNALIALASGQGRTDLLERAGDFDLEDEELEKLLAQLDEVLVVDGNSLWRLLKRTPEPVSEHDGSAHLDYGDIDWDAVLAHPKLAQYRSWSRSSTEQTGLGVLLSSIAGRFKKDVEARRGGGGVPAPDEMSDPDLAFGEEQPEDEEAAETEEEHRSRRRLSAKARAKRQFHSFIRRFVVGMADEQFVDHVGSSVVIPSYVVFNHLCWKLSQLDITDPLITLRAQAELWRFFWGGPGSSGYLASLSEEEQLLALDILAAHHSEAVLLCSLFKAYDDAWYLGTDSDVAEVRDVWRIILQHSLWQPTAEAVADAATALEPACESAHELVENLYGLAEYATANEALRFIEGRLGLGPGRVRLSEARVNRGQLGQQNVRSFIVDDPTARLEPATVGETLGFLRELVDEDHQDYIRVELPAANVIAFADFTTNTFIYADRSTDEVVELERPAAWAHPWQPAADALMQLAG
jgi:hypothetical protein